MLNNSNKTFSRGLLLYNLNETRTLNSQSIMLLWLHHDSFNIHFPFYSSSINVQSSSFFIFVRNLNNMHKLLHCPNCDIYEWTFSSFLIFLSLFIFSSIYLFIQMHTLSKISFKIKCLIMYTWPIYLFFFYLVNYHLKLKDLKNIKKRKKR